MNHKLFVIQIHSFDSIKLEEYFKDMGHVNAPQKSMLESDSELVILNSIEIFSFLCVKKHAHMPLTARNTVFILIFLLNSQPLC